MLLPMPARAACVGFAASATGLSFGTYDPGTASANASQGTVTVQCAVGILAAFSVALSQGSGSYSQRVLTNGGNRLRYNLYMDPGHAIVWGDGTGGTSFQTYAALIALGATSYTVYGAAPAGQYPAQGFYTDVITATVTF